MIGITSAITIITIATTSTTTITTTTSTTILVTNSSGIIIVTSIRRSRINDGIVPTYAIISENNITIVTL